MADTAHEQPRVGEASEATPLLGGRGGDETADLGYDRADIKSMPVTALTIISLVLASVCLLMVVAIKVGFGLALPARHVASYPYQTYPVWHIMYFAFTTACLVSGFLHFAA
jgi:hypothetical protein